MNRGISQSCGTSVQTDWTDVPNLLEAAQRLDLDSNADFIKYVMLFGQINQHRLANSATWKNLSKRFVLGEPIQSVRARHTLLQIAALIERNKVQPNALSRFKPSHLKLLVRFPTPIQDEVIRRDQSPNSGWRDLPSNLSYSGLRRLALKLCLIRGISYRKRPVKAVGT
jgi:hypothetical protein